MGSRRRASSLAVLALAGCAAAQRPAGSTTRLPPLGRQAEVQLFLAPLPPGLARLSFEVEAVTLRRRDGAEVPLAVVTRDFSGADRHDQRLLARGRVPPGDYAGVGVRFSRATLAADGEPARLLVEPEPERAELELRARAGDGSVVWLSLDREALRSGVSFAPHLRANVAPQTAPQAALYVSDTGGAAVLVADRRGRTVTGLVPVGAEPKGIALDRLARRAYVALAGEDELDVLDVAANASLGRVRLMPGDGPCDLAIAADGVLVVVNVRSRTVAFVDAASLTELGRVPVGLEPTGLLVDRGGRRAYVANRGSGSVSVIDVPNRAVIGTIATDPEPLRMGLSADGNRLYVVQRGSAHLGIFDVRSLAAAGRAYVGLGAVAVKVDSRSDLVYLAWSDRGRISVYDPIALQPIDSFDVPGRVFQMAIDDAESTLLLLMPERGTIAVVDLTGRRVLAEIPAGLDPYALALSGERP